MKTTTKGIRLMSVMLAFSLVFVTCNNPKAESLINESSYKIASPDYAVLAEKSLDLLASFEFDSFASMLADDIEYEFPDGKKISGKSALINYWANYKTISGIKSMNIVGANYLPIDVQIKPKGDIPAGIRVIVDFTNKLTFEKNEVLVKMNFSFHFNQEKMIDRITTYYDSSTIKNIHEH